MPTDSHEKLYSIALDLQKQMGVLGTETAKQSEILKSIETQVKYTNGRVTKLEGINITNDKSKAYVKGQMAAWGVIAGGIGTIIMSIIIKLLSKYF